MSAHVTFTITAAKLTPGKEYRAGFDWQGKGSGEQGYTSASVAPADGKLTFDLSPAVLIAMTQAPGPGNLELSVVNTDTTPLGPAFTVTIPIA